jgi:hypothetical protein
VAEHLDPAEVEEFTASSARGLLAAFPDLEFLVPTGQLRINLDRADLVALRLELPTKQFLHLHSIRVIGLDGEPFEPADLVAGTKRTASSAWRHYADVLAEGTIFDPDPGHGTALHTLGDEPPWCEIEFDEPVAVSQVVLRNLVESTSRRARGLRVLIRCGTSDWELVYDGGQSVTALTAAFATRALHRDFADWHHAAVDEVLAKALLGDFKAAAMVLDGHSALDVDARQAVRSGVSAAVLSKHEHEWTIHGAQRSFRFWSEAEVRDYVGAAVGLAADIATLTDKVCFGFGSALGLVRDGGPIPHDDDIDLIVGFEQSEAASLTDALELLRRHLEPLGYSVTGKHLAHRWVSRPGDKAIDVFAGIFEGDTIAWYPGRRGSLTRELMFPVATMPLHGHSCPLPRDPAGYLEQVYGPTWRVPNPGFAHRWERTEFADLEN